MASFLRMPGVSADSDEAVLNEWTVTEGAEIHEGDIVASVETEKAVVDIETDQNAVVHTLLVVSGATVPVGDPIAVLLGIGEDPRAAQELLAQLGRVPSQPDDGATEPALTDMDVPQEAIAPETDAEGRRPGTAPVAAPAPVARPAPAAAPAPGPETAPAPGPETAPATPRSGRIFASPLARRIARESGLQIDEIEGSGPGGRIVRKDVEGAIARRLSAPTAPAAPSAPADPAAAAAPAGAVPAAPAPSSIRPPEGGEYIDIPHSKLRRLVASRLQASKAQAPHFYLRATVRVDSVLALRQQVNASSSVRVSINDFFVKAAAKALADVPEMNVVWTDDAVRRYSGVDISVAIATEKGLLTPVVRSAEKLSLTAVAATIKDFAARAGEGRIQQHELEGGSFSVTNLGMFGVDDFAAIINPPQVGILAIGAAVRAPVVGADDTIEVGTVVTVTLAVDHRPVDGVLAAQWLKRLRELLEDPIQILL